MRIKNVNKNEYFIEENGVKILSYILAQDTLCIGSGDILIDDKLFIKIISFLKESVLKDDMAEILKMFQKIQYISCVFFCFLHFHIDIIFSGHVPCRRAICDGWKSTI